VLDGHVDRAAGSSGVRSMTVRPAISPVETLNMEIERDVRASLLAIASGYA
jgi:hypothetical protein